MESHSNENLLKRLEEAREQVLNQMGPNPEKPNKEAMLKVINAMDDELAIHLLHETLNKETVLGKIFYIKRGLFKANENSGIFIEVKKALNQKLNLPKIEIQVPQPTISPSLSEGLKNSFTGEQLNLINNAIKKTDFSIIYSKIAMVEDLIGKNNFIKLPKFKGKNAFNIQDDLSRYFPEWLNFDDITKFKIIDILNNEKLKTFSIRAIPGDDNFIVDINPFTKKNDVDGSIKPTGNVFRGSIARALSFALLIPKNIPAKDWTIDDAILQKKNIYNAKKKTQQDEITALQRTGTLLFAATKVQKSTGVKSIHTFKKMNYGIKANDHEHLKEIEKSLSSASEGEKIKFQTNFVLSFINEHLFLREYGVHFDDVATRNILLSKSGLINLIDYAGLDSKQDEGSILYNISDTLYDIRFHLGLMEDKTSRKFYETIHDILSQSKSLEQAKENIILALKNEFYKYSKEINESVNYTENEFLNKIKNNENKRLMK